MGQVESWQEQMLKKRLVKSLGRVCLVVDKAFDRAFWFDTLITQPYLLHNQTQTLFSASSSNITSDVAAHIVLNGVQAWHLSSSCPSSHPN